MGINKRKQFRMGAQLGLPIALGYLPVSFAFGIKAAANGIAPIWSIIISMTNLTSAGQVAAADIIGAAGTYAEMALTTLVINARYMLMSISLTQKTRNFSMGQKLVTAFGVTDEIFVIASTSVPTITFPFMLGLIAVPYVGWTAGTVLGAFAGGLLPEYLARAMEISLYAMFIAIIVPAVKRDIKIVFAVAVAAAISAAMYFLTPFISSGWVIIIAAVAASALGATFFPRKAADGE